MDLWQNSSFCIFVYICKNCMKTLTKISLLVVFVFIVVFFGSPYYKLYGLKSAYEKGDYQPIIDSIDFDTLRPNLKNQLYQKVDVLLLDGKIASVTQLLGLKQETLKNFGVRFVDATIDGAITTENLSALSKGEMSKDSERLLAGVALMGGFVDMDKLLQDYLMTGDIQSAITQQKVGILKGLATQTATPQNPQIHYCGFNCFAIDTKIKQYPITIMMSRRHIVDWQIDNIILP